MQHRPGGDGELFEFVDDGLPSGLCPQMLMPWWVVGFQVDSSTTIGFQPTSHSKPDGVSA